MGAAVHSPDRGALQVRLAEAVGPRLQQQPTLPHVPASVVPDVLQSTDHVC